MYIQRNALKLICTAAAFIVFSATHVIITSKHIETYSVHNLKIVSSSTAEPGRRMSTDLSSEESDQLLRSNARRIRETWKDKSFVEFKTGVYLEPFQHGKYIVNGDTPIQNEKLLREFFQEQIQKDSDAIRLLLVKRQDYAGTVWNSAAKKTLSYCVSRNFGDRYNKVVSDMKAAALAWSNVADVKFNHVATYDGSCSETTGELVFDVRPVNVNGQYLARAFFPHDPRVSRNIFIDNSSFELDPNGKLTLVGILRHQLGHVLGLRHPYTRPDSGPCFEDGSWRPLTNYQGFSVMHYPQCGGMRDWPLTLNYMDANIAACLYGPAKGFTVDSTICPGLVDTLPVTEGIQIKQNYHNQHVKKDETKHYGPYPVLSGTILQAKIFRATGDPDLYVQYGNPPTTIEYSCRPYTDAGNEECLLDVPNDETIAFVSVRGYSDAEYSLSIVHVATSQ